RRAVAEMHRVVRPGGYVIVNVAALESLRGDHSVLSREVRRYDRGSLSRLLTAHGFEIVRMTYTNAVLFPPMFVARALQRWRGLRPEESADQEMRVPAAPVNLLMTGALRIESWWLRVVDNPFGSSLLCLARKPSVTPGFVAAAEAAALRNGSWRRRATERRLTWPRYGAAADVAALRHGS